MTILDFSESQQIKSKITNLKMNYSEFLGLKLKVIPKGNSYIVKLCMNNKSKEKIINELKCIITKLEKVKHTKDEYRYVNLYNSIVWIIHNYYQYATDINEDCNNISYQIIR